MRKIFFFVLFLCITFDLHSTVRSDFSWNQKNVLLKGCLMIEHVEIEDFKSDIIVLELDAPINVTGTAKVGWTPKLNIKKVQLRFNGDIKSKCNQGKIYRGDERTDFLKRFHKKNVVARGRIGGSTFIHEVKDVILWVDQMKLPDCTIEITEGLTGTEQQQKGKTPKGKE